MSEQTFWIFLADPLSWHRGWKLIGIAVQGATWVDWLIIVVLFSGIGWLVFDLRYDQELTLVRRWRLVRVLRAARKRRN